MTLKAWLEARGIDIATLGEDEITKYQGLMKVDMKAAGLLLTAPPSVEPVLTPVVQAAALTAADLAAASADAVRQDRIRQGEIRRICASAHPEIEARAIETGLTPDAVRAEVLTAERAARPVGFSNVILSRVVTGDVLEAALALSARISNPEKHFAAPVLDAAAKRFKAGLGLQEFLIEAARHNGYTGTGIRDHRAVLEAAFPRQIQAGFSTLNIAGILSNTANKSLREGFMGVESAWRAIADVRPVSDFKTVTSYRLTGANQYQKIGPAGEFHHGTLADESYTNKVETYGLMLAITRQQIINDDLGALTAVPRRLGRGAGLKLNDVFWTAFLDNSSFFATGNSNYISGATTNLSIDSLTSGELKFARQTDPDGKPLGLMPAILLVPPELSVIQAQLKSALEIRDTTASTKYPVSNPHAGKFTPVVSTYLSNSSYTGYSTTAWYLLANPADLATIEVAFLNGQESPTVEQADADFNTLGIQMRGYHDFGVTKQEYRAGVKSAGA